MSEEEPTTTVEKNTYTVQTTRSFEIDFTEQQEAGLKQQVGAPTIEDAIEEILLEEEIGYIRPEEKLITAEVQVDEPSDD